MKIASTTRFAVIGGGPAGLRAAEILSQRDTANVHLFDTKRSVGRKFLVAGKSGLNITNAEALPDFLGRYSGPSDFWQTALSKLRPDDLRSWVASFGIDTFVSSGNKVFPESMKAAPLLRRWVTKLKGQGVNFHTQHRLTDIERNQSSWSLTFSSPDGDVTIESDAVILAMGGASWPQTGSTGSWKELFEDSEVAPFQAANCGWESQWPEDFLEAAEGKPLKNISVSAGRHFVRGELMVTRYGLEGGPLYQLAPELRCQKTPTLLLDLKPTFSKEKVTAKLAGIRKNYVREASRRLKLDATATALLKTLPHLGPWKDIHTLASVIKRCPIPLTNPRPVEEAISTAGGIRWQCLDADLMLKESPGIFCAGEMIDWEAPTGGYLLQGCFATGTLAAESALTWTSR